jgi:hypothetical protein
MRRPLAMFFLSWLGLMGLSGCGTARLVQVDQGGGVVAIPANTNAWPTNYRKQAEELMRQQCPAGYEIVSEREEVVGHVETTDTETQAPPRAEFVGVSVPLDNSPERTKQTTHVQDVTEWRIYFRHKGAAGSPPPSMAPPPVMAPPVAPPRP